MKHLSPFRHPEGLRKAPLRLDLTIHLFMPATASLSTPLESPASKPVSAGPLDTVPLWRCGVLVALAGFMLVVTLANPSADLPAQSGVVLSLPNVVDVPLASGSDVKFYGSKAPVSEGELGILPADTEIVRKAYDDFRGQSLVCTVLLSGAEQRSIHRAEVCLPGQGWTVVGQENLPVPLASGHKLVVRNLAIQRDMVTANDQHHLVRAFFMYWFVSENQTTPSHFMRVFMNSWDRILYNRAHRWAYIMVMSPETDTLRSDGLNAEQTQAMMTGFIRQAAPSFQKSEMTDSSTR